MSQNFQSGDFLVFQLESGFALLRVLAVDMDDGEEVWHVAAYRDFYPDVETADAALMDPSALKMSDPHIALTSRAFESTQVAKMANAPLTDAEIRPVSDWRKDEAREVSDRSVRLMLGLR